MRAPEILLGHCALHILIGHIQGVAGNYHLTYPAAYGYGSEMMLLDRHARTLKLASGGYDSLPCSSHDIPVLRNDLIFDIARITVQ